MEIIARIKTDFPTKFGIPRQSGLIENEAVIVFENKFKNDDALRGIEGFSHLWLIWQFSENADNAYRPTVRPPRLGGNKRVGVFATRSPFRPNSIGLSSVKLKKVEKTKDGTVLIVSGADLMNNTPIIDIKPYLAYTDSHPDAVDGFAKERFNDNLEVNIKEEILEKVPKENRDELIKILSFDPRPHYIEDERRVFGFLYKDLEIKFTVKQNNLNVLDITKSS